MPTQQLANQRGPAAFGLKKVCTGEFAQTSIHFEIQRIADAALRVAENLLTDWLPDGTRKGKEYWPTNPVRGDRKPGSFSINLHTGKWNDFASGDKGGDLVSLLAYLRGCSQIEATRILAGQLGLQFGGDHKRDLVDEEVARQRMARKREQRQQQDDEEMRAKWEEAADSARRDWALAGPADPKSSARDLAFKTIDEAEKDARARHRQVCAEIETMAAGLKGKAYADPRLQAYWSRCKEIRASSAWINRPQRIEQAAEVHAVEEVKPQYTIQTAATASQTWREADAANTNHLMSCDKCHAATGRYCAAGAGLRQRYNNTPMEASE